MPALAKALKVVVVGPPGAGKTTLCNSWLAREAKPGLDTSFPLGPTTLVNIGRLWPEAGLGVYLWDIGSGGDEDDRASWYGDADVAVICIDACLPKPDASAALAQHHAEVVRRAPAATVVVAFTKGDVMHTSHTPDDLGCYMDFEGVGRGVPTVFKSTILPPAAAMNASGSGRGKAPLQILPVLRDKTRPPVPEDIKAAQKAVASVYKVVVVGPSGSGKTTLCNAWLRQFPWSGEGGGGDAAAAADLFPEEPTIAHNIGRLKAADGMQVLLYDTADAKKCASEIRRVCFDKADVFVVVIDCSRPREDALAPLQLYLKETDRPGAAVVVAFTKSDAMHETHTPDNLLSYLPGAKSAPPAFTVSSLPPVSAAAARTLSGESFSGRSKPPVLPIRRLLEDLQTKERTERIAAAKLMSTASAQLATGSGRSSGGSFTGGRSRAAPPTPAKDDDIGHTIGSIKDKAVKGFRGLWSKITS